jgi:hypothetical protein
VVQSPSIDDSDCNRNSHRNAAKRARRRRISTTVRSLYDFFWFPYIKHTTSNGDQPGCHS